jgi:hypothetical protein
MQKIIGACALLVAATFTASAAELLSSQGPACSKKLAQNEKLSPAEHRDCVIAVASTYIDAEENSITPDKQLVSDDVSRHSVGTPPNYAAGNGAKITADHGHSVIAAIKNRQWTVDGDQAWIAYDGYLKSELQKPSFYVVERFTIVKGLIREILIAPVAHTDDRRQ